MSWLVVFISYFIPIVLLFTLTRRGLAPEGVRIVAFPRRVQKRDEKGICEEGCQHAVPRVVFTRSVRPITGHR